MINLIPPEGQKAMRREYYFRVCGTLGILWGCVILALAVALIPTYVLISAQIGASVAESNKETEDTVLVREADREVETTKKLIAQLAPTAEGQKASALIETLERTATEGIFFKNFVLEEVSGNIVKIVVQGTAKTREELADLKTKIEATKPFARAEVPIADLARDVDLPFTITITLEKQ